MFDEKHSVLVAYYLILDGKPLVVDMKMVLYEVYAIKKKKFHILLMYCHIFQAPINQNVHDCF